MCSPSPLPRRCAFRAESIGYERDAFTVYHRLYDILNLTVISDHDTVGYFDMESEVIVEH